MKRILIIDDEIDLCQLLKIVLVREPYLVDCALSLSEAGPKLLMHPEIIFLDSHLTDGLGLEYLQKHREKFINSQVILITADVDPEVREKALKEGISIFVQKPFSMKRIKEIIKNT